MLQKDISKLKKDIEAVDVFFITGSYFKLYFKKIQAKVKTVALGNKNITSIPDFYDKYLVGIYRLSDGTNISDLVSQIRNKKDEVVLISKKDTAFSKYRADDIVKNIQKHSSKKIKSLTYTTKKDLDTIFQNKNLNSVLLWPASAKKKALKNVLELQKKYKGPLIAQRMPHIKQGSALGFVLDYDSIIPELGRYIDSLASGVSIEDLKSQEAQQLFVVNMKTVSRIELKLSKMLIKNSKIVGVDLESK